MSQYTHLSRPDTEFQALYEESLRKPQETTSTEVQVGALSDPMAAMRKEARVVWVAEADRAYGHLLPGGKLHTSIRQSISESAFSVYVQRT